MRWWIFFFAISFTLFMTSIKFTSNRSLMFCRWYISVFMVNNKSVYIFRRQNNLNTFFSYFTKFITRDTKFIFLARILVRYWIVAKVSSNFLPQQKKKLLQRRNNARPFTLPVQQLMRWADFSVSASLNISSLLDLFVFLLLMLLTRFSSTLRDSVNSRMDLPSISCCWVS